MARRDDDFFTLDDYELKLYIKRMKQKSYKGMISDATAIARQSANDIKRVYKDFVPKSSRTGATKEYGFKSGNLRRSLRLFKKRKRDPLVVEFSVGFKMHLYGQLKDYMNLYGKGTRNDGWYGSLVDAGVAGRQRGKPNKGASSSAGFRGRSKGRVNSVLARGISGRGVRVLKRRLEKDLLANR